MKRLVAITSFFILFSACEKAQKAGDVRVRIPWPTAAGTYQLSEVKLTGVRRLNPFSGAFALFTVGPKIDEMEQTMYGNSAGVSFIESGGLIIPRDDVSTEVLAIYAHMERLHEIDAKLGIQTKLRWPRQIGLRVLNRAEGSEVLMKDNAFYHDKTDTIFIVPYSRNVVPMSLNAGILAHEHFHAIFQKFVGAATLQTPLWARGHMSAVHLGEPPANALEQGEDVNKAINWTVERGVNEGFADFWGWLYTKDEGFITRSLPEAESRVLQKSGVEFPRQFQTWAELIGDPSQPNRLQYAYNELTNRYASFLRALVRLQKGPDAGFKVARAVVASLPLIREELVAKYDSQKVSTLFAIQKVVENLDEGKESACELYFSVAADNNPAIPKGCGP